MKKVMSYVFAVTLVLNLFTAEVTAADDDSLSYNDSLVIIFGVNTSGEMISKTYWNGFVIESTDGVYYVIASDLSTMDSGDEVPYAYGVVNENSTSVAVLIGVDSELSVAIFELQANKNFVPFEISNAVDLDANDEVSVYGIDWSIESKNLSDMIVGYDTKIKAESNLDNYCKCYILDDSANNETMDTAVILDSEGFAVGYLIASDDMNSFIPLEYLSMYVDIDIHEDEVLLADSGDNESSFLLVLDQSTELTFVVIAGFIMLIIFIKANESAKMSQIIMADDLVREDENVEYAMPANETANDMSKSIYSIFGVCGEHGEKVLPLETTILFGEASECNLVYRALGSGISDTHCIVSLQAGIIYITDLGSKNGTYVNGKRLVPYEDFELVLGDEFYLADPKNKFFVGDG